MLSRMKKGIDTGCFDPVIMTKSINGLFMAFLHNLLKICAMRTIVLENDLNAINDNRVDGNLFNPFRVVGSIDRFSGLQPELFTLSPSGFSSSSGHRNCVCRSLARRAKM